MVKLIHADGFFPAGAAEQYCSAVRGLNFTEKQYGSEIENFSLIFPGMEPILSRVLGERIQIDSKRSGVFRQPMNVIHFEEFDSLNEWCFVVALERTTLNLWHHISDHSLGEVSAADAKSALDGYAFNYRNLFEWKIHTNVVLEANSGVFFRPWVFHSLENGLVQYYRLISDRKFRILVMGLPGSARSQLAQKLHKLIPDSELLRSSDIRKNLSDVDFTHSGRMRHTSRMLTLARQSTGNHVIIDMVAPLAEQRELLNPDIIIWAQTKSECDIEELRLSFEPPENYDFSFASAGAKNLNQVIEKIQSKRI
jgi:hypothetical protein